MKYLMLDKKRELGFFRNEKGTGAEMCPTIVWDRYRRRVGQLLANVFSPVLTDSPRSHRESFLLVSKEAN